MSKKSFFTLLLLSICLASCASNKNKKVEESRELPTLDKAPISVGSIVAKMEMVNSGAAELKDNEVMVKVIEVLGYGASTQPLAINQVLTLAMPSSFDQMSELKKMKVGQTFEGIIKKSSGMGTNSSSGTWNISKLNNRD